MVLNCAKGVRGATFSNIKVYISISIGLNRDMLYICIVVWLRAKYRDIRRTRFVTLDRIYTLHLPIDSSIELFFNLYLLTSSQILCKINTFTIFYILIIIIS